MYVENQNETPQKEKTRFSDKLFKAATTGLFYAFAGIAAASALSAGVAALCAVPALFLAGPAVAGTFFISAFEMALLGAFGVVMADMSKEGRSPLFSKLTTNLICAIVPEKTRAAIADKTLKPSFDRAAPRATAEAAPQPAPVSAPLSFEKKA